MRDYPLAGCRHAPKLTPNLDEEGSIDRESPEQTSTCASDGELMTDASTATMGSPSPLTSRHAPISAEKRQAALDCVSRMAAQVRGGLESRYHKIERGRSITMPLPSADFQFSRLSSSRWSSERGECRGPRESETVTKVAPFDSPDNSVVCFDWDDTLLPTWFIMNVVNPCSPFSGGKRNFELDHDSPFYEMLQEHARIVRSILTIASSLARVVIVTLAQRPWVKASADMYLPGMWRLLEELGIKVYYARELNSTFERGARTEAKQGVNPFVVAKRFAMAKCMRRLYGASSSQWNVISVGDSMIELEAIKELLWCSETGGRSPLCKTVKLMEDPRADQLGSQLRLLAAWLKTMIKHGMDIDLDMSHWDCSNLGERDVDDVNCVL